MNTVQYKPRSEDQVQSSVPPGVDKTHIGKKKKLNNKAFKISIQTEAEVLNLGALKLGVKV